MNSLYRISGFSKLLGSDHEVGVNRQKHKAAGYIRRLSRGVPGMGAV